jgi:hypothetical protein
LQNLGKVVKVENNFLEIENLEIGNYILILSEENNRTINIEVLEGKFWKDTKLILTKNALIETNQISNQLVVLDVKVKD